METTKKTEVYLVSYIKFFSLPLTKLQSNYREAQQAMIFNQPTKIRCAKSGDGIQTLMLYFLASESEIINSSWKATTARQANTSTSL